MKTQTDLVLTPDELEQMLIGYDAYLTRVLIKTSGTIFILTIMAVIVALF